MRIFQTLNQTASPLPLRVTLGEKSRPSQKKMLSRLGRSAYKPFRSVSTQMSLVCSKIIQKISLKAHHALELVICRAETLLQTGDFASSTNDMTGHRTMNIFKWRLKNYLLSVLLGTVANMVLFIWRPVLDSAHYVLFGIRGEWRSSH